MGRVRWGGVLLACGALGACAAIEMSVPVTGRVAGQPVTGQAIGKGDGNGSFFVDTAAGRCGGSYNALATDQVLTVPVRCADGRTGTMTVTRRPPLLADGSAVVTLSDGTRGQFVFGKDIKYEEAFPGPDATAPAHRAPRRQMGR